MSTALFWAAHSFEWPTLVSTFLSNKLFWELFLVIYSWEQFFEPSFEQCNSFEHFFEHSQECTYSQEHFFEWIYSHECSFGHFWKGSRSTTSYLHPPGRQDPTAGCCPSTRWAEINFPWVSNLPSFHWYSINCNDSGSISISSTLAVLLFSVVAVEVLLLRE